jgi:hypothetical protein
MWSFIPHDHGQLSGHRGAVSRRQSLFRATRAMHGMFPHHLAPVVRNAALKLAIQSIRHKKMAPVKGHFPFAFF